MRRGVLAICAVMAGMPVAGLPASADCAKTCDSLRLNEIQIVGTGESYKQRPGDGMLSLIRLGGDDGANALDYAQPPVADQLDAGARSLEFDIAYDPKGGLFKNPAGASMADELLDDGYAAAMSAPGFKVIHVPDIDFKSSCMTLRDCLGQVAAWLHKNAKSGPSSSRCIPMMCAHRCPAPPGLRPSTPRRWTRWTPISATRSRRTT